METTVVDEYVLGQDPDVLEIVVSNVQLHAQSFPKPKTVARTYARSLKSGKNDRAFSNDGRVMKDGAMQLRIKLGNEDQLRDLLKKSGKKSIRLIVQRDMPVSLAPDAQQKMKSHVH